MERSELHSWLLLLFELEESVACGDQRGIPAAAILVPTI